MSMDLNRLRIILTVPVCGNADIVYVILTMFCRLGSICYCWLLYLSPLSAQVRMDFMIEDANCSNNGSVMILASGGTAPYSYEIVGNTCGFSNRSIQPSPLFLNLAPCTYTFWVMDASGQITTLNATVGGNYTSPTASVTIDGCGFEVVAKNGSPPLKYYLSTDGGKTYGMPSIQNTFSGLANGTYFIKIEDTCRSTFITSATLAMNTMVADLVAICNDSLSSLIELKIKNGTGPFVIREFDCNNPLNSGNSYSSMDSLIEIFSTRLNSGVPCFKVTDACQNTVQIGSDEFGYAPAILSQKNCDSTSDFYYRRISGASYTWTNSANQFLGDSPRINITDPWPGEEIKLNMTYKGCSVQTSLRIDGLTPKKFEVQIEANKRPDLCAGDSIRLNALITGGIEPMTYNWSNGDTSPVTWIRNTGIHTLRVRNASGCQDSAGLEVHIGNPLALTHSQKNIDCYGDSTGSLAVRPAGGIGPYQITWSDGTARDSLLKLKAGDYSVTLTDFAGCQLVRDFKLSQNNPLIVSSITQPATCGVSRDGSIVVTATGGVPGFTYRWNSGQSANPVRSLNPGMYQVTVTDQLACEATASIELQSRPLLTRLQTDTICAGTHLRVGNSIYTVSGSFRDTLKTSLGCDSIVLTNLTILPPLQYAMTAISPTCAGQSNGQITVSDILSKPPFILNLNGKIQTGFKAEQLPAGNYIIKLTDGFGCSTEQGASLSNPRRMELEAGKDSLIQIGDSVFLKALTNLLPGEVRSIQWTSDQGVLCDNCTSALIKPKRTQTIIVTLENHSGCKISDQFTLTIDHNFKIFAPNILYLNPGVNTQNSRFTLFSDQQVLDIEYLRIFDRLGDMVFEARNFQPGDLQSGWDGCFKNKPVESGVYVFLAKIRFADNSFRMRSGDLTVIR